MEVKLFQTRECHNAPLLQRLEDGRDVLEYLLVSISKSATVQGLMQKQLLTKKTP